MSSRSSKTTEAAAPPPVADPGIRPDLPDRVAVGRVLRPHGVRGEVVVDVTSDVPGRFDAGSRLLVARAGSAAMSAMSAMSAMTAMTAMTLTVAASRPHKSGACVRFEGIGGREEAEALRGLELEVERSAVPAAPAGTYYYYELLGCHCRDGGRDLGEVVDLAEDGGGLLLIVADGERRVPVPFVQSFLRGVDVAAGRIDLELPPGLLEVCASRS
jgi:16S rRNA processing protein RimM